VIVWRESAVDINRHAVTAGKTATATFS